MKKSVFIASIVLIAVVIVGCKVPTVTSPTPSQEPILTAAEETEVVMTTETQAATPTQAFATLTPSGPKETATTAPTATTTVTPSATPTPAAGTCTDLVKFVEDVTIPDNTQVLPAADFIKTWRLQNAGTCTWTSQYSLVFISGDQMNGTSPLPLTGTTAPGSTLDVSVNLKAPGSIGTYQGDWMLRNPGGSNFGSGTNASQSFYVLVKVVEGVSDLNLGTPTWTDNMDSAANWYLLNTDNTKFSEGDGKLVMTTKSPTTGDEWDVSNKPSLTDYYLQATFITGSACAGLDRYGLLARAPSPDMGYVLEFSCDGHYRLYIWDGKNYNALQEWQAVAAIKTGPNQTNVMGIWMKGSTLRVYANGFKLAEFTDTKFDHGQFGLVIGAAETNNFTTYVDQVSYWTLQ